MDNFIGVKMVGGKAMTLGEYNEYKGWDIPKDQDPATKGMLVKYSDDYVSWCPEEFFRKQNVLVVGDKNKIHPEDVENMISKIEVLTITPPGTKSKTTLVQCVLLNGFVITESSACVDPANYSEEIGAEICMKKIKDQIWFLMGFLMQSAVYGFEPEEIPKPMPYEEQIADDVCAGGPDCTCGARSTTKPVRHIVDALNRMDSELKEFICIDDAGELEGIPPKVILTIQSDPVSEVGVNGCQAQDILEYSLCLIQSLNDRFPCRENALTITHLEEAMGWQERRTRARKKAGVEGFNKAVPEKG